jgi:hypothetical protein
MGYLGDYKGTHFFVPSEMNLTVCPEERLFDDVDQRNSFHAVMKMVVWPTGDDFSREDSSNRLPVLKSKGFGAEWRGKRCIECFR